MKKLRSERNVIFPWDLCENLIEASPSHNSFLIYINFRNYTEAVGFVLDDIFTEAYLNFHLSWDNEYLWYGNAVVIMVVLNKK